MLDRDAKGIIAEGTPAELAASSTDPRVRDFLNQDKDIPKRTEKPAASNHS
jgi:phospholipid/cholesterol/gamma-HCH transport system ATP-binding protein